MEFQGDPQTGVSDEGHGVLPLTAVLEQNYPNPFNPSTRIRYTLSQADHATLKIFNIMGKEIASLVDQFQIAGEHEVVWNASDFPDGIYFYRLLAGDFVETKKLLFVK